MRPRIAIPQAHSTKMDFTNKCMPHYANAVELAGGIAVEIPVNVPNAEIMRMAMTCDGVLLPGSPADVNTERYGQERHPKTAADDPARDNADELLLQDAYNMHKPVLGICFGVQTLNVWRTGTLIQHLETGVQHTKPNDAEILHEVRIAPDSKLARILEEAGPSAKVTTNSSHHQAVELAGDGLKVVGRSDNDGVIEAIEGAADDHFVLGVQWHPERTVDTDEYSRAIFRAFIQAAQAWHAHPRKPSPDFEMAEDR
jgi:putative glutamine amidotransferase